MMLSNVLASASERDTDLRIYSRVYDLSTYKISLIYLKRFIVYLPSKRMSCIDFGRIFIKTTDLSKAAALLQPENPLGRHVGAIDGRKLNSRNTHMILLQAARQR